MEVFIARQPIFDRNRKVWAYELLFRSHATSTRFDGPEASLATQQVVSRGILSIGWDKLLRGKLACINFGREMILQDLYSSLPPGQTIIELTEDIVPDDEVLAAVREVRQKGYRIALDDFQAGPQMEGLIELAHLIKIEMKTPKAEQEAMLKDFNARGIRVLTEKVETELDYRWALRAGYDYFQGNFFAKPVVIQGTEIPALKLHCLRLIQEANRPELDFVKLTALISQDVSLSYKLLRYANSAQVWATR